jgi:adenylate kinase
MSVDAIQHPSVVVVIGCAGAGKGTFAQAITKLAPLKHLSTGDIMRDELKDPNSEIGKKYAAEIVTHKRMPFELIKSIVEKHMEIVLNEQKGIILDGYPKDKKQCEHLDHYFESKGLKDRMLVVLIDILPETAIERIGHRQTCGKCHRIYNSQFSPPKTPGECDDCHEKLKERVDDNPKKTQERVSLFKDEMGEVIDYYQNSGRLKTVDGNGNTEVCLERFINFYQQRLLKV